MYRIGAGLSLWLLAVSTATIALAAEEETAGPERQTIEIRADEFAFTPSEVRAHAGTPVWIEFRNEGEMHHNLTFPEIARGTPTIAPGESANLPLPLTRPGTYRFVCTVTNHAHQGLEGTLTMEEAPAAAGEAAP